MAQEGWGALPWRPDAGGVSLAAWLTARADRDAIEGVSCLADRRPVVLARVRAVAEDGKANEAARKLLAEAAGVPASRVGLVAGASARLKLFHMAGEPAAIVARLETALARSERRAR